MTETNPFERDPDAIATRNNRAVLYRKLREENDQTWKLYNKKKKDDDLFSDLLGPSRNDAFDVGNKSTMSNPKDIIKATKSCYQRLSSLKYETKDQAIQAIKNVKLNKFMGEVVRSLFTAQFKIKDIPAFVEVYSLLHQKYKEFIPMVSNSVINECKNKEAEDSRRLCYICLLADLLLVHAFTDPIPLMELITGMINMDIVSRKLNNFKPIWFIIKYVGGDIFGVSRGKTSVIDPVFEKESICPTKPIRDTIMGYYNFFVRSIEGKCKEGKENFEKGYGLIIKLGSINSKYMKQGKQDRIDYDDLREKAKYIAFLVKKDVPDPWIDNEEMTEHSTIDGIIMVPTRMLPDDAPKLPICNTNQDLYYDVLADMELQLAEPLGFDITALKKEVDHAKDSQTIDRLSRHYALIDKPDDRQSLINEFTMVGKNKGNQVKYYARFIANISQLFPDIGENVMKTLKDEYYDYIKIVSSVKGGPSVLKLHIARYIAELARFKIGTEYYFDCIDYSLEKFRPRSAMMACTLVNISGKFFDKLCDQTHTHIRSIIAQMKEKIPEISTHQNAILMVEQTANSIDPQDVAAPVFYTNSYNEYQAFITYIFKTQIEEKNFPTKAKRFIEKLLQNQEQTKIDMKFVYDLVLNLGGYSAAQLRCLASFVAEFSKSFPAFGLHIADILCERAHRFLESPIGRYRQRHIMETRFLAELANPNVKVVSFRAVLSFANYILSFGVPGPRNLLIKIEQKGKKIDMFEKYRDFFRIYTVARMIEALAPIMKQERSDMNQFEQVIAHLQIYTIARAPVPPDVANRISDLLDFLSRELTDFRPRRFESKEEASKYEFLDKIQTQYTYSGEKAVTSRTLRIDYSTFKNSSDSEEEDDNVDDLYEGAFQRDMTDVADSLDKSANSKSNPHGKITIPIELIAERGEVHLPKINSKLGPTNGFAVYTVKKEVIEFA